MDAPKEGVGTKHNILWTTPQMTPIYWIFERFAGRSRE